MRLGVSFSQTLSGTFHRLSDPGEERPLQLKLRGFFPLRRALSRVADIEGTVDAEGLATRRRVVGTLAFRIVQGGRLIYELRFDGDDGRERRFQGETELMLQRPKRSLERVFGRIFDDDAEEARVILHDPLEESIPRIVRSLRTRSK